jgi:hypothetical protein
VTALAGLAVSVAGNVGHIQPLPGRTVLPSDRLTAATSPLAAFAGLTVGLLVLRMNRQHAAGPGAEVVRSHPLTGATAGGTATWRRLVTWRCPATQPFWINPRQSSTVTADPPRPAMRARTRRCYGPPKLFTKPAFDIIRAV